MSDNHTQKQGFSQESGIVLIHKTAGVTLAELVKTFRLEYILSTNTPVTYAGRLDPMAEGVMLMLYGGACKDKDQYLGLDKTYVVEILLGISTDTYDVLGLITNTAESCHIADNVILTACKAVMSRTSWSYPPYSSKTVDGIPLFTHARDGTLPVVLPAKEGSSKKWNIDSIERKCLRTFIEPKLDIVQQVSGDFRQEKILERWKEVLQKEGDRSVVIVSITTTVTSGVYMRSMAHEIGQVLGIPGLAARIERIRIGEAV